MISQLFNDTNELLILIIFIQNACILEKMKEAVFAILPHVASARESYARQLSLWRGRMIFI